jgi:hypothetical protein
MPRRIPVENTNFERAGGNIENAETVLDIETETV